MIAILTFTLLFGATIGSPQAIDCEISTLHEIYNDPFEATERYFCGDVVLMGDRQLIYLSDGEERNTFTQVVVIPITTQSQWELVERSVGERFNVSGYISIDWFCHAEEDNCIPTAKPVNLFVVSISASGMQESSE